MSWMVHVRVGFSSRRDSGTIGKIWSIAQVSGSDWNSEKLQKYLSGIILKSSAGLRAHVSLSRQSRPLRALSTRRVFRSLGACLQVEQAEAEAVKCLFAYLQGVVPALEKADMVEIVPYLVKVRAPVRERRVRFPDCLSRRAIASFQVRL